ncbi:oligosaccharyl transferase, archaeosortase A system-associated [Halopelagius longus]|uniref:dolichyl-phosphooligosaccharide-protein glycotransferase n=1 Tax=Halopelagius longus TaxID=1236180 RepID=A0A1H1AMT9_9EURY|nr:oligosaccharyl transferase, archaeosortase A system-associated [Halopelagius longus]RDI70448.1 oligosaccharyl transferase, archaeosortase A system-associated [Halopelagius longus]SDQ41048.1 dolichyl-diphosphooligosaccharide--protein glycosyltransferase [Halopelagius longus]
MSVDNERREDYESPSVLERFADWYHVPALLVVMAAMLAIRLQSYGRFIRDGEVFFSGNDAWYHLREVSYTVRNWPFTMPFDPWTNFPYGTSVGQFGTLYDQIIATAALIVGLGSPSEALVGKVLLVAPAVFGALAAIPAYLIGKRLAGRGPALFGALLLGLMPGTFLQRTLVGFADHNAAEPFFMSMAVAALMVALGVAEREMPVWELVADRDVDAIRSPLVWSALAGVATALYMWVWPPGVLLVAIVGTFVVLKMSSDVVNGRSPEATAFVAAVSMSVTGVLMLIQIDEFGFSSTQFSLIQPGFSFAVAAGAAFLAWLAREWEARDIDANGYPVAVFGLIVVSLGVVALVLPRVWGILVYNFLNTLGFGANATTRTIGEAQPYLAQSTLNQLQLTAVNRIVSDYGFTFFTAVAAVVWMLAKPLVKSRESRDIGYVVGGLAVVGLLFLVPAIPIGIGNVVGLDGQLVSLGIVSAIIVGAALLTYRDPERLLVVVWAAFITSAAFTQVRFNYYLAVVVVVLNAYFLVEVLRLLNVRAATTKATDLETYQIAAIGAVLLLVAAPVLVVPLDVRNTGNPAADKTNTAWQASQGSSPGEIVQWEGNLEWMKSNTPAEGEFGGSSGAMEYYGKYEKTDDYQYGDGAYGVMSWWDYGHFITVEGERIPNANPFQQGATDAANFLLAPNETQAQNVLASQSTEGNQTRYVMVDWKMATPGSKFGAPTVFYDAGNISQNQFYEPIYRFNQEGQYQGNYLVRHQRYYESLMTRLYLYHGSAHEPSPVVVDWEPQSVSTGSGQTTVKAVPQGNETTVKTFDNMSAARQYVQQDGTSQIGGIGSYPSERVPALEHYRLVKVSNSSATQSNDFLRQMYSDGQMAGVNPQATLPSNPAWVKSFERVPGATVQGSGAPANSTVTASVEMNVPATNSTFTYTQQAQADENGEFTMTLPYATTGYDEYGPENGYTNVSVRANGSYTISAGTSLNESGYVVSQRANLSVEEGQVNGAEDGNLSVELQRSAQQLQIGSGSSDSGGDSNGGSSDSGSSEQSSLAASDADVTAQTAAARAA